RAARLAPGQVLGDERRLQTLDQPRQPLEVRGVQPLRAAERESHPVDRERIVRAQVLEGPDGGPAPHVILGVHLEPADGGQALEDLRHAGRSQTNPGPGWMHAALWT